MAKGAYHFDHSAGADLAAKYEVCTVDEAGNALVKVSTAEPKTPPARIIDDAPSAEVTYSGAWKRGTGVLLAYSGTMSTLKESGATVSLVFEGKPVLWFLELGDHAGQASVSIGGREKIVDTYDADGIWDFCVYRQELATASRHTLKITALGQHGPHAKDAVITIDGFRIER